MLPFIKRGLVAGAAGGGVAALCLLILGERPIRDAIAIEQVREGVHAEEFTRQVQVAGGMVALLLAGLLIGLVFSVVFVSVRHHSRLRGDFPRALALGAVGFATIVLAPFLKYPANPPSVGDPNTITPRTFAYLSMLTISVMASLGAWGWSRRLRARGWSDPGRVAVVAGGYLAVIALAMVVLPGNPDRIDAPATLIWRFRLASLAASACLWGVTSLVFGWRCERAQAVEGAGVEETAEAGAAEAGTDDLVGA